MKTKIDVGSGNTQSGADNTTQIQIGRRAFLLSLGIVILGIAGVVILPLLV